MKSVPVSHVIRFIATREKIPIDEVTQHITSVIELRPDLPFWKNFPVLVMTDDLGAVSRYKVIDGRPQRQLPYFCHGDGVLVGHHSKKDGSYRFNENAPTEPKKKKERAKLDFSKVIKYS